MRKAVIIGGQGKVGSFLVPMLVKEGFEVVSVSRGNTSPNVQNDAWNEVQLVRLDRDEPGFEASVAGLKADIVIDMICFKTADMVKLIDALRDSVSHYLVCGSVWMHGRSTVVPLLENECRTPPDEYGIEKSNMDFEISRQFAQSGFPGTAVHPGHIVCPRDIPVNPQGFKSLRAFEILREGEPLYLPNFGMETLHHVSAEDVAGVFLAAIGTGKPAFGEGYHAVSPRAVTLSGYAQEVAGWYGKEADLRYEPFGIWKDRVTSEDAGMTKEHIERSPSVSMEKARNELGFIPKRTTFAAVRECIASFGL